MFSFLWCLSQGLWVASFLAFLAIVLFQIIAVDPDLSGVSALLSLGVYILLGLVGDRIFFGKAYRKVLSDIEKATSTS